MNNAPVPFHQLPRERQIAQFRKQARIFGTLQYVMPGLMLFGAWVLPRNLNQVAPETVNAMVVILCVFAALDFFLIRFVLLPQAQKRIDELLNGQ